MQVLLQSNKYCSFETYNVIDILLIEKVFMLNK